MLPFRKMLRVVFAVVLILPALESGGFLSGEVLHDDCMDLLGQAGELKCGLDGQGSFSDYDPYSCTLKCQGPRRPKLPDGVCNPGVRVKCTLGPRETLRNWIDALTRQQNNVLRKWCPYFPKK
uniref:Putative ixodes 10 kDa peptide protein n=1 Tax=Ixodes ricinus TaxID=34613 RepID=A0A0K8R456_IXORI